MRSLLVAIVLTGCAASHDGGADGGPLAECAPIDVAGEYTCPTGCAALSGSVIDEVRACVTSTTTVLGCYPEGAEINGSGDVVCFTREGARARVWSGTGSVIVGTPYVGGPVGPELISSAGWERSPCENLATGESLAIPCPI